MNQDFETLREELEQALGGLDEQQTQLRTGGDPVRWSIQQIVGHLLLTYSATEDAMKARIEKATATKAKPSLAQRLGQFALLQCGYFPRGRKAPERVTAAANEAAVPGGILIGKVEVAIPKLDKRVAEAEKIFGLDRRSVSHMVLGPLSIRQWQRFHLIHGRHHIKQIATIRRDFGC